MLAVSDPQRLTIQDGSIRMAVNYICGKGLDPHEFATEYVNRTAVLGYAPNLIMSIKQFMSERGVAIA